MVGDRLDTDIQFGHNGGYAEIVFVFLKKRTGVRGVQVSGIVFASNCLARDRDLKYLGVLSLVLPMLPVFLFVFLYMFYGFPFLFPVHIVFWLRNLINLLFLHIWWLSMI